MSTKFQVYPTDDPLLNILVNIDGVVGDYINKFPGVNRLEESPKWLEDWFLARSKFYFASPARSSINEIDLETLLADIVNRQVIVVKKPTTILSILPHYFRGFRNLSHPINLRGKLVVIDGHNSSGKTSLAEAFEWLLSGVLVRRSLLDMGDAKELENCISNQLRPSDEQTWVEAEFITPNGEIIKIKRILMKDYGDKKSSVAESQLYINDELVNRKQEEQCLDDLLAGIPPVLMQHSLRTFVLSTPSQRRDYFERLLRLDELAYVIEKSTVGDARFAEFPSDFGSVAWKEWEGLKNRINSENKKTLKRAEQSDAGMLRTAIESALTSTARSEFDILEPELTIEEM